MRIAFLSTVFIGEYGVTRIVANQLPYLVAAGHKVDLYACDLDNSLVPLGVRAVRVPTHFKGVGRALESGNYDVVVACTDPFYKIVADLKLDAATIAYEHGYIPVELTIPEERESHRKMVEARVGKIYPAFTAVVTISRYAVEYIRWPKAMVLYNGGDHFAKLGGAATAKIASTAATAQGNNVAPLTVLMVTRFRTTEWLYKGLDELCRLKKDLGDGYKVVVVGGGDSETYAKLSACGIDARPPVKDPVQMAQLYAECDVLVSFSKCEMFNLPLVEAGFAHKPALALNLCAHPEVTPFVFDDYEGIRDYLKNATARSLGDDGEKMFAFVDGKFRSEYNGRRFAEIVAEVCPAPQNRSPGFAFGFYWMFWKLRNFVRVHAYQKLRAAMRGTPQAQSQDGTLRRAG